MERKNVVKLRRQQHQRKRHEVARKQQQPTEQLNREEERGKVRFADGDQKLNRERICRGGGGWWMKLRNPFSPKTVKISPSR